MLNVLKKHRLAFITTIFWVWLIYIIAALVWWFISLENQNRLMYGFRISELKQEDPLYIDKVLALADAKRRKSIQYIGEGIVSFGLILLGAGFLYRATRRQIRFSTQQQNFMMAITHELKTPIAVSRLNLETIRKRKLSEEMQNKLIENILAETERLNTLTSNILFSAQLESGQYRMQYDRINISATITEVLKLFKRRATQHQFVEKIEPDIFILGEELLLQLLMNNLLSNAVKYAPPKSTISVILQNQSGGITVKIIDEGTGIAKAEKKKVFKKFYRIGNEAQRKTKGTGLGLYLCKKIVKDMRGSIEIADNIPNGCIFILNFPNVKNGFKNDERI